MEKNMLEYITSRTNDSETGSIKAVSCPDIRALLAERAELLEALQAILDISPDAYIPIKAAGYDQTARKLLNTIQAARAAIAKATE